MLLDIIKKKSLEARKAKDTVAANLLGMVLADVQNRAKEAQADPTDHNALLAVKSMQKKNSQAIDLMSTPQLLVEKEILDSIVPPVDLATIDLSAVLKQLTEDNPDKYQAALDNPKSRGWFRGQLMKVTAGKSTDLVDEAMQTVFG